MVAAVTCRPASGDMSGAAQGVLIDPFAVYGELRGSLRGSEIMVRPGVAPPPGAYVGAWGTRTPVIADVGRPVENGEGPLVSVQLTALRGILHDEAWGRLCFVGWLGSGSDTGRRNAAARLLAAIGWPPTPRPVPEADVRA